MGSGHEFMNYCDSVSCLHAFEHFGLGRYGDNVDASGYTKGLKAISSMLKVGGKMYLSVPVGVSKVMFNAHRVFDPREIINTAIINSLHVKDLVCISSYGSITTLGDIEQDLKYLSESEYNLAVYTFVKEWNM